MRKTERRLPAGFQAADLGEAVAAADGRCALISFATAPIVAGYANSYVLMVTDAALAAATQSVEWTFRENGVVAHVATGEPADAVYAPTALGQLTVTVRALGAGNAEQAALTLEQLVVTASAEVEALVADAQGKPGPGASNPAVMRELVNQHCRYYREVAPRTPEPGDAFLRFVFGTALTGAGRHTPEQRREHIERLANALEQNPESFPAFAANGLGVAQIRLTLLAMVQPQTAGGSTPFLPWQELPEANPQHAFADEQLRARLATLSEDSRVDLLNIARFPKSNLAACARILEALRDRYFPGTNFEDVLTGLSGTRAHWITRHLREGPLLHT